MALVDSDPAEGRPADDVRHHRRPVVLGAVMTTLLTLGVGATSVAVTFQQDEREAEPARGASQVEAVAQASDSAFAHRLGIARTQQARADHARGLADRAAAVAAAAPQVEAARAALAASPRATPETRAALRFAVDGAAGLLATDPPPQVGEVTAGLQALAALQAAVVDSQAAWQVVEDARLAASRSTPASPPGAPAALAPVRRAEDAREFSAAALGDAVNAYRAAHDLPRLRVLRSGGLYEHASAMAQRGSIWHSGSDSIVGYVTPAGASALVQAWAESPEHDAWLLESGVSEMHVGAAVVDDALYGAVAFS